jgi:hypothetical protein
MPSGIIARLDKFYSHSRASGNLVTRHHFKIPACAGKTVRVFSLKLDFVVQVIL